MQQKKSLKDSYTQFRDKKMKIFAVGDQSVLLELIQGFFIFYRCQIKNEYLAKEFSIDIKIIWKKYKLFINRPIDI